MSDNLIIGSHFYINNCIGSFLRGTLDWFGDIFYPRIKYKVIGTYDKSVEFFNKKKALGFDLNTNLLPSITLDPSLDIRPEEKAGRFLWQADNIAPRMALKLFDPIEGLEDQSLTIVPVFSRYQGEFSLVFWFNSVYEYLDTRIQLYQYFGGVDRRARPECFISSIIIPECISDFRNDENIPIDWSNTDTSIVRICNTAKDERVLPVTLCPIFWITDISDGSSKFGSDGIAEYKLVVNCSFEVDLPTHILLEQYTGNIGIDIRLIMDNTYSRYGSIPKYINNSYQKTEGNNIGFHIFNNDGASSKLKNRNILKRAYYTYTAQDITDWNDNNQIVINYPYEGTEDLNNLLVVSYSGILSYGDVWNEVRDNTNKITQLVIKQEPKEFEIVEIFLYE